MKWNEIITVYYIINHRTKKILRISRKNQCWGKSEPPRWVDVPIGAAGTTRRSHWMFSLFCFLVALIDVLAEKIRADKHFNIRLFKIKRYFPVLARVTFSQRMMINFYFLFYYNQFFTSFRNMWQRIVRVIFFSVSKVWFLLFVLFACVPNWRDWRFSKLCILHTDRAVYHSIKYSGWKVNFCCLEFLSDILCRHGRIETVK